MAKTPDFTDEEWNEINKALEEMNGSFVTTINGNETNSMEELFGSVQQEKNNEEQPNKDVKHSNFDTLSYFNKKVNVIGNACKEIINKLNTIFNGLVTINNKIDTLNKEMGFRNKDQAVKDFYKLGIKSVIPDLTPKQLYGLKQLGWTLQEISAVSGYSPEQVIAKIKSYAISLSKKVNRGE